MLRLGFFILLFCGFALPGANASDRGSLLTLWPLADYRTSPEVNYRSLHLFGPLLKFEEKGAETEFGLRPLFYRAADHEDNRLYEFLYPLASLKQTSETASFQLLHLLNYDFGSAEQGSRNEFSLFPLIFYGQSQEQSNYLALFPFGGRILGKFGRDEIRFALFPLYVQTRQNATTTTSLLWPLISSLEGENETGLAFWPFYGESQKTGSYRKQFWLWPIFFRQDLNLDSPSPTQLRAAFPFYISEESPEFTSRTLLWPFFSHHTYYAKGYEEWNFPLPFLRLTRGESRHGNRFLPFYADEQIGSNRKRWFLWPIYKIEEMQTDILERRRERIFFFLFSNLEERRVDEPEPYKKRLALWPLFSYQHVKGVSHFHLLALAEPFFPESSALERNWSPLWRLYQKKWDTSGNSVSTLFWNLYWKEVRGDDLAMEVFPLFTYSREADKGREFSLLKGLFRYRSDGKDSKMNLFYLPWDISWERAASPATARSAG